MFEAALFHLFAKSGKYEIPNLGLIVLGDSARAASADSWGGRLKALDAPHADEAVAAMRAALGEDVLAALTARFRSDRFLDWAGVKALKAQGVEIGAHAHRHWPMHGAQSLSYLREQAQLSRARIETELGECRYFAYPFGNVADVCRDAWHAVRDAGYEYAFTTLSGSLDASLNRLLLPRYGLRMQESRLPSLVPVLRTGNARLRAWQRQLS
jgi:peptidoglycan/xylan/chitin deacetylase (PgdA/CDA1 family)